MKLFRCVIPLLFLLVPAVQAVDVPFSFSFTASNLGGPVSTISGTFAGSYTPIIGFGPNASSLTSISLNIAGFAYTTANTGLDVSSGLSNPLNVSNYRFFSIYGSADGSGASGFTNDFLLSFLAYDDGSILPSMFYYDTPSSPLFFDEDANIGTYSITRASSVADSGSALCLFSLSFLGLVAIAGLHNARQLDRERVKLA